MLDDALRELGKIINASVDIISPFHLEAILRAYAQPATPPQYKAEHGCSCPAHTGGELCNCGIGMPAPSKPKPLLRLRYEDTADGQVAITILEQEGIKRGCGHVYTAKNGVEIFSDLQSWYDEERKCLFLRGYMTSRDLTPFLVSPAEARRIQEAVQEWRTQQ